MRSLLLFILIFACRQPEAAENKVIPQLPTAISPAGLWPGNKSVTRIVVHKKERRLLAFHGEELLRSYKVALGRNPKGHKQYEGDNRTPEGHYTINGKNPHSQYFKNLGISYPNAADRAKAKTLGKSPGGDVKIHGLAKRWAYLGKLQSNSDWTYGCIALSNEEMEELFLHTSVGTPIWIKP